MSTTAKSSHGGAARLLFVHALSSLHCGVGQGTGAIDLPIAREAGTNLPYLPGSGLKGNLRAAAKDNGMAADEWLALFGPETENASDHAGALSFGDARLVAMPVRSLGGTFAWVTTAYLLNRLARDAQAVGLKPPAALTVVPADKALVATTEQVGVGANKAACVLDELDFALSKNAGIEAWAQWIGKLVWPDGTADAETWRTHFQARLIALPDDDFQFLCEHGTEVVARVAIDPEKGTVAKGALWYEERLPAESLLVSIVLGRASRRAQKKAGGEELLRLLFDKPITRQFGGKVNVGRGLCRVIPVARS